MLEHTDLFPWGEKKAQRGWWRPRLWPRRWEQDTIPWPWGEISPRSLVALSPQSTANLYRLTNGETPPTYNAHTHTHTCKPTGALWMWMETSIFNQNLYWRSTRAVFLHWYDSRSLWKDQHFQSLFILSPGLSRFQRHRTRTPPLRRLRCSSTCDGAGSQLLTQLLLWVDG